METQLFSRKPFFVRALPVTLANMFEIAGWTKGEVRTKTIRGEEITFVWVPVIRPRSTRQEEAFVGDWVVAAGTGFKVYTAQNFARDFERVDDEDLEKAGLDQIEREDGLKKLRDLCGGVRKEVAVGEAAQSHFEFQSGVELDWNRKGVQ